ncbi:MAG: 2-iminobutanoate/2-iminopropanoate deaminase [Rhodothermales bacterium]|jgi:2-iminobutanoate/2-iminopropanoate deaminase
MMRTLPLLFLLFTACQQNADYAPAGAQVEHLNTPEYREMGVPFSEAVRVDNMLYLSGQVGNTPGAFVLVEGGIEGETRQTMDNIVAALGRYGSSMDEVVKCTVFLADMAEWGAMNEVYRTYFPENPPARSAVGATGLALDARVEIECFAALR